ncbi:MAG: diguanylate cyclase domain-containing protein [Sulfuricaulis sp.]
MGIESATAVSLSGPNNTFMSMTSNTNPETRTTPINQGMFASLRERLAQRPDSEHQAAMIRIVIAVIVSCYIVVAVRKNGVLTSEEWHAVAMITIFIPFSIGILISIFLYPQVSVPRRVLSMVADLSATTYALYFLGDVGTPVYGMYLFNACGNGFRFGARYLFLSAGLGVLGFTFVLVASEYWVTHRTIGIGLLIVLIVIPMYFASLVRQLHAALARMRIMATCDTLTDLPNRHSFYEQLQLTLRLAERSQMPFAVVFVDLDDFKPINDALGHAAGDTVLKSVARRLEQSVRKNDIVARFGGDEFVIILSNIYKTEVPSVVRKIIDTVARPHEFNGKSVTLTSSVGIASYPDSGRSVDELVAQADAAMYQSKRAGRNRFCVDGEPQTLSIFVASEKEHGTGPT